MSDARGVEPACPVPIADTPRIVLAHGGGMRASQRLFESVFLPAFGNPLLNERHDGAVFPLPAGPRPPKLAFSTDAYVVNPLFFPGGTVGTLAVNGTVNDLAMCGARPLYLSAAFILEEGLPIADLERIVASMRDAAAAAGVAVVTGDTKVVDRGKGDGVFITTAGVGLVEHDRHIAPAEVRAGDAVLLSGDVGRHGIAIMAAREGLDLETTVVSDCAPLVRPVLALLDAGVEVHCLRDLTRGGLAAALVEIAEAAGLRVEVDEDAIPVADDVAAACELLGFDPLHVANEGRFTAFVAEADATRAVALLRDAGCDARSIGRVTRGADPRVVLRTRLGTSRLVDLPNGEQLPRIC